MISAEIGRHTDDPQLQQWLDAEVAKPLNAADFAENYSPAAAALRPSASESFVIRKPAEWSVEGLQRGSFSVPKFKGAGAGREDMSESPVPPSPTPDGREFCLFWLIVWDEWLTLGFRSRIEGTNVNGREWVEGE